MQRLLSAVTVIATLRIAASLLPSADAWGVNVASWMFDAPDILLSLVLPFLLLVPAVRAALIRWMLGPGGSGIQWWGWGLAAAAAVGVLAWTFPVAHAFLGDGAILLSEVLRTSADPEAVSAYEKPTSWLTGLLLRAIIRSTDVPDMRTVFTILGVFSSVLLIALLWWQLRSAPRLIRIVFVAGMLGSAASLFFLRYVELYALQYALTAGFCAAAWRSVLEDRPPWIAAVLLPAAVLSGLAAVIYLPALLVLLLRRRSWMRHAAFGLAGAIPLAAAAVLVGAAQDAGGMLAAWIIAPVAHPVIVNGVEEGRNAYTLFSAVHLVDCVNALWLLAGPVLVVILFGLRRPAIDGSGDTAGAMAVVLASSLLTFLLLANTLYGMAQDWDLVAVIVPGIVFIAAVVLARLQAERGVRHDEIRNAREGGRVARRRSARRADSTHAAAGAAPVAAASRSAAAADARTTAALLAAALVLLVPGHLWPWIRVNASPVSASRFETLVERSTGVVPPWNTYRSLMNLTSWYSMHEEVVPMFDTRVRQYATGMLRPETAARMLDETARIPVERRSRAFGQVFDLLEQAWNERREARPRHDLDSVLVREMAVSGLLRLSRDRIDSAFTMSTIQRFGRQFGTWPEVGVLFAAMNAELDARTRSSIIRRSIGKETRDPFLCLTAGSILLHAADTLGAIACFERTAHVDPSRSPDVYADLARIYHARGATEQAIGVLERGIAAFRGTPGEAGFTAIRAEIMEQRSRP